MIILTYWKHILHCNYYLLLKNWRWMMVRQNQLVKVNIDEWKLSHELAVRIFGIFSLSKLYRNESMILFLETDVL